jgi:hypothetical protein
MRIGLRARCCQHGGDVVGGGGINIYSLVFDVFVELFDLGSEAEHGVEIIGEDLRDGPERKNVCQSRPLSFEAGSRKSLS